MIKFSTKKRRVLIALTERSYNRFEAERLLHDHCLHATVSTLQNKHDIEVCRKFETVPGYQGAETHVCRYWIASEHVESALRLAKFWS